MPYLCTMKNENDMDTILKEHGFVPTENTSEYVKGVWTIRIEGDYIEAFDSPEDDDIRAVYVKVHKERIYDVLEDINKLSSL